MLLGVAIILFLLGLSFAGYSFSEDWKPGIFAGVVIIAISAILSVFWFTSTESGQRTIKTLQSETTGGLERTVEVYDQHGNLIRTYEGRIDIKDTEYGNKVLFDLNGKRVVLYNAMVIVEEK